jgi:hypothetical protein
MKRQLAKYLRMWLAAAVMLGSAGHLMAGKPPPATPKWAIVYDEFYSICVATADGSARAVLYADNSCSDLGYAKWSPYGNYISFRRVGRGGGLAETCVIKVDGTDLRRFATGGGAWGGGWVPQEEKRVLFADGNRFMEVDITTDAISIFAELPAFSGVATPSFSPDTHPELPGYQGTMAFGGSDALGYTGIWIMDIDLANGTLVITSPIYWFASASHPQWSPDGSWLLSYIASEAKIVAIHTMDSYPHAEIAIYPATAYGHCWAGRSTQIVFSGAPWQYPPSRGQPDLCRIRTDGIGLAQFFPSWKPVRRSPDWNPTVVLGQ